MSDRTARAIRTVVQVLVGAVPLVAGASLVGVADAETVALVAGVLALLAGLASLVQRALEDNGLIPRIGGDPSDLAE